MGIEVKGPNPVQGGSEIEKRKMGRRRLRSKGGESEKRKRGRERGCWVHQEPRFEGGLDAMEMIIFWA